MGGETVKVLDMSAENTICGDISVHVLEELENISTGSRLIVKTRLPEKTVLESIRVLEEAGLAKLVDVKSSGGIVIVVIEKR